jgi:hypothetical protein
MTCGMDRSFWNGRWIAVKKKKSIHKSCTQPKADIGGHELFKSEIYASWARLLINVKVVSRIKKFVQQEGVSRSKLIFPLYPSPEK